MLLLFIMTINEHKVCSELTQDLLFKLISKDLCKARLEVKKGTK